ncbi:MAG: peptidylprolyl isomerase [Opitutaceae bacterium]|nr:peptidylprolyl isomerase [Opitutaceae bacterium]
MSRNIVTFHYTLRDGSGRMIDMSVGGEPVTYMEGAGQIIDGLEAQLSGLPAETKTTVIVAAAQAYGERDESLLHKVNRSLLPVEGEVNVGDQFRTAPDPRAPVVTVASVEGDEVTLDANHPLAGVDLTFHVEIVAVREASAAEIEEMASARRRCGCGRKRGSCKDGDCNCEDGCGDGNCDDGGDGNYDDGNCGEDGCACER